MKLDLRDVARVIGATDLGVIGPTDLGVIGPTDVGVIGPTDVVESRMV